jgi:hypothetical protein
MSLPEVVPRITKALDAAGIPYMLTGSFASAHYGPPRSTQDIDVVIEATAEQLRDLTTKLEQSGYYVELDSALEARRRESLFNVIDLSEGWKIDLIFRKSRSFSKEEFTRRRQTDVGGTLVFIASVEDVIIAKLEWAKLGGSVRQLEDVAAVITVQGETLDKGYIQKWVAELGLTEQWKLAREASEFPE